MDRSELLALLKPGITRIDETMREDLAAVENPLLQSVLTHTIFQGGKRVRPLLTLLAARSCGQLSGTLGEEPRGLYQLAITFEYLHAASLLHDDVIDRAHQRRGSTSANVLWGPVPAILAGDYLHARAMLLAGTNGKNGCLEVISRATEAMIQAEFLQMQTVTNQDRSEENYLAVLAGKTAALLAAPCEVGVLYAGGSTEERTCLRQYGTNLGLAFQIVDDLLDYQGNPQKTGKEVGNDFCEGKMTLPLLHALQRAGKTEQDFLTGLLQKGSTERRAHFPAVLELIAKHESFVWARKQAERYVAEAVGQLVALPDGPARDLLTGLAQYVLSREH